MSRLVVSPVMVQGTAPETFSVLHQRMNVAEEQTESLLKELGRLGVCSNKLECIVSRPRDPPHSECSNTPLHTWTAFTDDNIMQPNNCESLVNRICHMESLTQTLKLHIFRLHTEKELNPKHSEQLHERLSSIQEEHAQEMKRAQVEIMRLHHQLCEESDERDVVQEENQRLSAALEMATAMKTEIALAAEELRATNSRMNRRLLELQEQLSQEMSLRASLEEAQATLFQRVQDLEQVLESEREKVQTLQRDCQTQRSNAQSLQDRQQQEEQRAQHLEEEHAHLKAELDARESIIIQLREEGKNALSSFNKELAANVQLCQENASMREMTEKVQAINEKLEKQCSEFSDTLRSLTVENAKLITDHQAILKGEQEKMARKLHEQDLLLDAARSNIKAELQGAQRDRERLERELLLLCEEHSKCSESACLAEQKMSLQKELLDSTIARLRGELEVALKERDIALKEKESLLQEKTKTLAEITDERNKLENELTENKLDLAAMNAALRSQETENRHLMDRLASMEHQQHARQQVEQAMSNLTDSKNKLAYEKGKLQTRVQQLEAELESLADANSENIQLRKLSLALEAKYNQVNSECSASKIHIQRSEAHLKQAQSVMERQEQDFVLAIKSRDEAMRECQKMKGHLEAMEERERQKINSLQRQLSDVKEDNNKVSGTLENVLASHSRLQHTVEKLQTELGSKDTEISGLRKERSQGQQKIQRLESEIQESQSKIISLDAQQRSQVEPLRKAFEVSREDNKKLALSLEQSLQSNSNLQSKLNHVQDDLDNRELQLKQLQTCREQENEEAKVEAKLALERLEALKKQFHADRDALKKKSQRETMELKTALEDATSKWADLSSENRLLNQKVAEMARTLTYQKSKLKSQKSKIKHYQDSKATGAVDQERTKEIESDLKEMAQLKEQYQKENHEQSLKIQEFLSEMTALQGEIQELAENQQQASQLNRQQELLLEGERKQCQALQKKCQGLEDTIKQLKKYKEITERTLKEASVESAQISLNLEEAHRFFRSKFNSLNLELMRYRPYSTPANSEDSLIDKKEQREENEDSLSTSSQATQDAGDERPTKLKP